MSITTFLNDRGFQSKRNEMQTSLDLWILQNPSENGYFTIVQYDDGPLLNIPTNTVIFG